MTLQLARRTVTQLRDDHIETNPVTTTQEKFILLEQQRGWTAVNIDELYSGLGGSNAIYLGLFASVNATNMLAPDGSNTGVEFSATGAAYVRFQAREYQDGFRGWPSASATDKCSFLIVVKGGTGIPEVRVGPNALSGSYYIFDSITGAVISGPDTKVKCMLLPNGWLGLYGENITLGAALDPTVFIWSSSGGLGTDYTPPAGSKISLWWGGIFLNAALPPLPFTGITPGLDNTGDGKFPFYNPVCSGGEITVVPLPTANATPAALTVYIEWLDRGNALAAAAPGIFRIGNLNNTGNGLNVTQSPTGLTGTFTNGGSTSVSTLSLTANRGDLIALRATLSGTGVLTLNASKNGGSESAGTSGSAAGLPGSWSEALIMPNCLGYSAMGDMALRRMRMFSGVVSLATATA